MDTPKSQDLQDFQNKLLEACKAYDNATELKLAICRLMFDPLENQEFVQVQAKITAQNLQIDALNKELKNSNGMRDEMQQKLNLSIGDCLEPKEISLDFSDSFDFDCDPDDVTVILNKDFETEADTEVVDKLGSKDTSDEISDLSDFYISDDDSVEAPMLDDKNDDDKDESIHDGSIHDGSIHDGNNDEIDHDSDNQMQSVFAEQMQTYEKIYSKILKFGNFIKSQFDDEDDETEPEQVTDVTEVPMTDDKIDESENTEEQIESLKEIISSLENEIAEQKVKIDTLENSLMEKNDNAEKVENLEKQIEAFKEQVECLKDNIRWLFDQKEASNDKLEKSNLIIADQKSMIDTLQDDCEDFKYKIAFFSNEAKCFSSLYDLEKAKTKMIEKDLKSAQDKIAEQEIDINKFKEDFAFIEDLIKNIDVLNVCQR